MTQKIQTKNTEVKQQRTADIDELRDAHTWYLLMFVNDVDSTDNQYLETLESLADYVED